MYTIDEQIQRDIDKLNRLKRKKKVQDNYEKKKQKAIERDRNYIIGELITEHFPEVKRFQPHRTKYENQAEFAPFINFLLVLLDNEDLIKEIKKAAVNHTTVDNEQST